MNQQFSIAPDLSSQSFSQAPQQRPRSGMGNGLLQEKIRFTQDVQTWLSDQLSLIEDMDDAIQRQRFFGVVSTLSEISRAFQMGENPDVSQLPTAPTANHMPSMAGMLPEFSMIVRPYLNTEVANARGPMGLLPRFAPKDAQGRETSQEDSANKQGASLNTVANLILGLRLHVPREQQTFSVKKHGDPGSVILILQQCVQMGIKSADQVAYILSTAWTESRMGKWMTESGWMSESSAEKKGERRYGPNGTLSSSARRLGNTNPGDGGRYMGRGYVQLTWKNNYARMSKLLIQNGFTYTQDGVTYGDGKNGTTPIDLVTNYRHVNRNQVLAARILVLGMDGGHYVNDGKGLDSYIPENKPASLTNFDNARQIVNGSDKKTLISDNAMIIAKVLRKDSVWLNAYNAAKGNTGR